MPRLVRNFFTGHVSRTALLTALLVGFASFFSSLIIGILLYPGPFDWRKRVLSRAISPDHNPEAYWIPALGIAAAALLFLPFAGYVARRLHGSTPQAARLVGVAFLSSSILFLGVALPLPAQMPPGLERLHEVFARASAGAITVGMLCCFVCALKDRLRALGGQRVLRSRLAFCWMSLPLLLVAFGLVCGIMLLGRKVGMEWALRAGQLLRPTMFWQLAFWEWVGVMAFFTFLFLSALWLPERVKSPSPSFRPPAVLAPVAAG